MVFADCGSWESRFYDPYTATGASTGFVLFAKPSRRVTATGRSFSHIANRALDGESSSKRSSFLRPLRCEANNTLPKVTTSPQQRTAAFAPSVSCCRSVSARGRTRLTARGSHSYSVPSFLTVHTTYSVYVACVRMCVACDLLCDKKDCVSLTANELPNRERLTAEHFLLDIDAINDSSVTPALCCSRRRRHPSRWSGAFLALIYVN